MRIIKDGVIVTDNWLYLDDDAGLVEGDIVVSLLRWQAEHESLKQHQGRLGISLSGDDSLEAMVADLAEFALIVLLFPVFTDGRCYSFARLLRDRYDYQEEIRARGDVLQDQLFYMAQCGINSFEMENEGDLVSALSVFDTFSENYQATTLRPDPLYRRR